MEHIVIIVGHARTKTYCEAIGESYLRGAVTAGHEAKLFVTSKLSFAPILHEGFERVQPLERDLKTVHDAMIEADHLVFIFPCDLARCLQSSRVFWSAYSSLIGWRNRNRENTLTF